MNGNPLVSVVIIFLNAESFIQAAIESVFAQTYRHWELLLADDGSANESTAIARSYAEQWPDQVHYLEHPGHQNRGMSASRNLGIRHARGHYIAFLDSDDVWLPRKLGQQVAILASQPEAAMVYGRTKYWYSWTGNPEDGSRDYVQHHGIKANVLYKPQELLAHFLRGEAAVPSICSVLVRREFIQEIDGFHEEFRGLYEDQVFYAKVCLKASVFVSNECWDQYRQHSQSHCSLAERQGQSHSARLAYLNWLEAYMLEQDIRDTAVWKALRRAQWQVRHPSLARLVRSAQRRVRRLKVRN